jgi:signal transduction histidine kinase
MFGNPVRFLRRPVWGRSLAYLLLSVPLGLTWLAVLAGAVVMAYALPRPAVSVLTVYAEAGLWPFDPFRFGRWARFSDLVIMGTWALIAVALFTVVARPVTSTRRWRNGRRRVVVGLGLLIEATLPIATFDDEVSVVVGLPLTLAYITLLLLAVAPVVGSLAAGVERRLLRWLGVRAPGPAPWARRRGDRGGAGGAGGSAARTVRRTARRLATRWRDPRAWSDLGGVVVVGLVDALIIVAPTAAIVEQARGVPTVEAGAVASVAGFEAPAALAYYGWLVLPAALLVPYAVTAWAALRVSLVRVLVARTPRAPRGRSALDRRLVEVTASRARILDAYEAERRRIERDLHDGAQQRLTGLIMTLGLVRLDLGDASPRVRELVDRAQDEARAALAELRDLVRGIYPQVLADRGLGAAVEGLAERCAVPVRVDIRLPERLPEPVESAAYFTVAEALANIAKHSGARRAEVSAHVIDDELVVEIQDDGAGDADPAEGGGLVGLADRVAVHDGALKLSSPPGGPTVLRVEIPVPADGVPADGVTAGGVTADSVASGGVAPDAVAPDAVAPRGDSWRGDGE